MIQVLSLIIIILLLTRPRGTPIPAPPTPDGDGNGNGGGPGHATEPNPADVISTVTIQANIAQDTYGLIRSKLGLDALEMPDVFSDHTSFGRHLTQIVGGGPQGQDCFRFFIHPQDRDKGDAGPGKARNEIKAETSSPNTVKFFSSDIGRFHWWFRMPSDYQIVDDDILMQLHATGGGVQSPIVKLQAHVRAGGGLEVTHEANNTGGEVRLDAAPFSAVSGRWLECEVIARFTNSGFLKYTVWDSQSGNEVISTTRNLDMFHGQFLRPKWGIYRDRNQGKAEFGDWADFKIQKLNRIP